MNKRLEAGFSLLELVVAVGVLTVILGVAFSLMSSSQVSFDRNQLLAEAHQNTDFAVTRVTEILRGAGANPEGASTINSIRFITNQATDTSPADPTLVRIRSDLDGDGLLTGHVDPSINTEAAYYIIVSEDVTLQFYLNPTTIGGVDIPGRCITMTDNNASPAQPIVLAENIVGFSCPVVANPREVTLTIVGGPSRPLLTTDPRYVTFTRVMQIRLRNRN